MASKLTSQMGRLIIVAAVLTSCRAAGTVSSSMVRACEAAHYDALAWSPDGEHIAYQAHEPSIPPVLYVMNPDGTNVQKFSAPYISIGFTYKSFDMQWLPDSQTLAFVLFDKVFTIDLDGNTTESHFDSGAKLGIR